MVAQQPGQAPKVLATDCYDSSHASMAAQPAQHSTLPSPIHNIMSWPLGSAKYLSESAPFVLLLLLSPIRIIPRLKVCTCGNPSPCGGVCASERLHVAEFFTIMSRLSVVHMNGQQQGLTAA